MSDDIHLQQLEDEFLKNIKIQLNSKENDVPFGYTKYIDTHIGSVFWMCSRDEGGRITSVFFNSKNKEREITYLANIEQAIEYKNILIKNGWEPIKPKLQFSFKK